MMIIDGNRYRTCQHCGSPVLVKPRVCLVTTCRKEFYASYHNQRYCSRKCSRSMRRLVKREWWKRNGNSWRAARKGKVK